MSELATTFPNPQPGRTSRFNVSVVHPPTHPPTSTLTPTSVQPSTPDFEGYEEDTRVVLGYGDCQDEAIGGKEGYGMYAHCFRRPSEMYPFLNSTEEHVYVCECNPM